MYTCTDYLHDCSIIFLQFLLFVTQEFMFVNSLNKIWYLIEWSVPVQWLLLIKMYRYMYCKHFLNDPLLICGVCQHDQYLMSIVKIFHLNYIYFHGSCTVFGLKLITCITVATGTYSVKLYDIFQEIHLFNLFWSLQKMLL